MTAEAQTIPENIMQDAKNALQVAKNRRHPIASIVPDELIVEAIAEALLAEREHCAKVADRYGNFEIDTEHGEGYATAASNIAAAIRAGA